MALFFVLIFLVVPLVELYVLIQVGSAIGALPTIALLVVMGALGGWLMRREGLGVINRVQSQLRAGRVPAAEVVDGFLILFGGALMLTPGFLSDALGLALLIPPVRALARAGLARRLRVWVIGRRDSRRPDRGDDGRGGHNGGSGGYLDV